MAEGSSKSRGIAKYCFLVVEGVGLYRYEGVLIGCAEHRIWLAVAGLSRVHLPIEWPGTLQSYRLKDSDLGGIEALDKENHQSKFLRETYQSSPSFLNCFFTSFAVADGWSSRSA